MSIAEQANYWLRWKLYTIRSFMARTLLCFAVWLSVRIAPWSLDETE
jgi:hypothetical protein